MPIQYNSFHTLRGILMDFYHNRPLLEMKPLCALPQLYNLHSSHNCLYQNSEHNYFCGFLLPADWTRSTQPKCDFNMDCLNQIDSAAKLNDIIDNHMGENMIDEEFDAYTLCTVLEREILYRTTINTYCTME